MQESEHPIPGSAGATISHSDALPVGARLGEFEITGLLGVGGFGMVYSAYDQTLHRTVAIKEYMPSALAGRTDGQTVACRSSADQDAVQAGLRSFIAEARLLAQFDHPSLVKVYRFWEANNTAYMVMPLYRGMTLKEARYQMKMPPPETWLRALLWSILGALKYLHSHSTVHRDISPDNIFLQDAGPPVLLDLGAARRAISGKSQKHTAILKVNYAPIEQYADAVGMAQGPWTDLYALAAVIHGCLCDAPPVPATFRAVQDTMVGFASVAETIRNYYGQVYSVEFVEAFSHALEIRPQNRPQSVDAFMDELKLVPPHGGAPVSWREGLQLGTGGKADADAMAKTMHQTKRVTDIPLPVDAPETDPAPLVMGSAYGLLEQESPLLHADDVPEIAIPPVTPPATMAKRDLPPAPSKAEAQTSGTPLSGVDASQNPAANLVFSTGKRRIAPLAAGLGAIALLSAAIWHFSGTDGLGGARDTGQTTAPAAMAPAPGAAPTEQKAAAIGDAGGAPAPASSASLSSANLAPPAKAASAGRVSTTTPPARTQESKAGNPPPGIPQQRAAADPASRDSHAPANPGVKLQDSRDQKDDKDRLGPEALCADRNFIARPMCLFQECEKPEFTNLAFCVENRRRLKESAPNRF